ncbi:MAG: LytTR family DNA-binding domain-containing protein [Bacteroidales bacterium]|nr:LytTR family DNA-binding domain-containing protein [Bacteroidales bacterium]
MNVLIIEDESATARRLQKLLLELDSSIEVLAVHESISQTVNWLKEHGEPDLMFMDVNLSDGLSFGIFKEIEVNCPVIFTTAYDEYAIQAFKVNSIDYLLKPINKENLADSLNKYYKLTNIKTETKIDIARLDIGKLAQALGIQKPDYMKRLIVRYGEVIKAIEIKDVAYFYSDEKIVFMTLREGKTYPVDFTLDHLENRTDPELFFRINRKFLISYHAIEKMISYSKSRIKITLDPPCELEAISSTERSGDFKEWLAGK